MAKKKEDNNLVTVSLFKDSGKYKDDVTVGLNGRVTKIKRGETVQIAKDLKEILDHSAIQDTQTANMISGMEDEYKAKEKALN